MRPTHGDPTAVLVVEDDATLLEELTELVDASEDFCVVGAFATGTEALAFDGAFAVAIVDLGLPDMSGTDVIRALAPRSGVEILVHTVFDHGPAVFEAIVAGASGYLLKGSSGGELLAALRSLREGGSPMSPRIAREVVTKFQRLGSVAEQYVLTHREGEILRHLDEGFSYKETAARLHISPHTVHTHIKRIYEKLHAHGRAEALTKAKARGLI